jgi:CheY-like chemotaxis protein
MGQIQIKEQPSILVVEDEVLVRLELVDLIEELGFRVYEAGNADDAIRVMETNPSIQVLITDIDMPGSMDGLKLSHYVRNKWPPVKIVVASGHVRVNLTELPEEGIFLNKPYDTARIRNLLANISAQFKDGDPAGSRL